jgi:KDO2-lipid IV(A) lauroyltransferase
MRDHIEYWSLKIFISILKLIPQKAIYRIMLSISRLFFKFEKRRSSLTKKNLSNAFPEKTKEQIDELALKSYESVAITLAEIILMLNNRINLDDMVEGGDEFLKKLELYTKEASNGIVIITAHFSNWELAAQYLPLHGFPMVAIGREGNNKLIEQNITTPFRQRHGNRNIYKTNALLSIIKALKKNQIVGLLYDQKAGGQNSVKADFFGMEADTTKSIAEMKLKLDPKIVPIFFPRNKEGKYTPIIFEPVEYTANEESEKEKKIQKITQKYNDILEEVVREYPQQWFWMHNRWRIA